MNTNWTELNEIGCSKTTIFAPKVHSKFFSDSFGRWAHGQGQKIFIARYERVNVRARGAVSRLKWHWSWRAALPNMEASRRVARESEEEDKSIQG
jgi:hypothetical protein